MGQQITVRLPKELASQLAAAARARGTRRSQLVREAIAAYLVKSGGRPERPFDRVQDLAGVVYGGPPDLGARHREYLRERFSGG